MSDERAGEDRGSGSALNWPPDSGKFRLLAGVLLVLCAGYGVAYLVVCAGRGWPRGFGDSFALWSWGHFLRDHPATAIYDTARLHAAQLALGMDPGASYPFVYPPSYLPLLWLLGRMPGPLAGAVMVAATLPLYLWATVGRAWRSRWLLAALAAPTTAIGIVSGQSGFLTAALFAGAVRLAATRPLAAGVLLGLLSYKPQLGLLVPVALVAARLWRTLAAAALAAVLLVVVTTLLFGAAIWPDWAAAVPAYSRQFAAEGGHIMHLMPTIFAALVQLGTPPAAARTAQWTATLTVAVGVWMLFRRGWRPLASAGLLVGALLATPYAFVYDLPILATAVIWLVAERQRAGAAFGIGEIVVMTFALLSPVTLAAASSRLPVAALSFVLLFGMILLRARRAGGTSAADPIRPTPAGENRCTIVGLAF